MILDTPRTYERAFLLALEIERLEDHKVYSDLGLHCTVLHWFRAQATCDEVVSLVKPIFQGTPPVVLKGGDIAYFGPSQGPRDIEVNLIHATITLRRIHRRLAAAMESLEGLRHTEPDYLGDNFNFHVTRKGSRHERGINNGDHYTSTYAYVIEALDPVVITDKVVRARIPLLGSPNL